MRRPKPRGRTGGIGWNPLPGSVCRVNGHVGRYVAAGVGAYLAHAGSSTPPEQRPVRYYRATRPEPGDAQTDPKYLPTNEQLAKVEREIGASQRTATGRPHDEVENA